MSRATKYLGEMGRRWWRKLAGTHSMRLVTNYLGELGRSSLAGWSQFWFTPADPATLALVRIAAGGMLFYTHLVWTLGLDAFFGPASWVSPEAAARAFGAVDRTSYAWSYFWLIESPGWLWTAHIAALVVFAMLTLGLASRVTSVLSFLCAVSYVNRVPGAQFGLDQINIMLAMYLMLGPCGAAYSLDRLLAARRGGRELAPAEPSTSGNIAIRLIQLHMCVIYFFAAVAKLQGDTWFAGSAIWGAVANLEYQSLDMTWLAGWPVVVALLTQVTVYWELTFCVLIWPRLLRPLVLAMAVPLHLGIAFCMGMITFGLIMLVGCLSFVPPAPVRAALGGRLWSADGAGQGSASPAARRAARPRRGVRPPTASGRRRS